jgi:hypothetical protein
MTKPEIRQKLEKLYEELDELQETEVAQNDEELMWEIGEAMGSVDNAIDILDKKVLGCFGLGTGMMGIVLED